MGDAEARRKAKKRVEAKLGFYIHLAVYIGVNILLIVINFATRQKGPFLAEYWFIWPLFGWGIGVAFHALLLSVGFRESSLTERMIEKELKKMRADDSEEEGEEEPAEDEDEKEEAEEEKKDESGKE